MRKELKFNSPPSPSLINQRGGKMKLGI